MKIKNILIELVVVLVVGTLVGHGLTAWVVLDMNPLQWPPVVRMIAIVFSLNAMLVTMKVLE